jgi:hypothetical protein
MKALLQAITTALIAASSLAYTHGRGNAGLAGINFRAKMNKNRGFTTLEAGGTMKKRDENDSESPAIPTLSLKWSYRGLAPETNYSIIIGFSEQKCGKNFDVELASEPLATFMTDTKGKASGNSVNINIDALQLEESIATGFLKGRPIALVDSFEQVSVACGRLKRTRNNRRKDKRRKKDKTSTSGVPTSFPLDIDAQHPLACSGDSGNMGCKDGLKCAAFNRDASDLMATEHFCVPMHQITCENTFCTTELGYSACYQEFDHQAGAAANEVICISASVQNPANL